MVIFGAILAYYVRFIAKKIHPFVKYDTLAVFLGMILFAIPIILLLYFTFTQFVSIAGTFFGSLHQAATGNSTMNMSQLDNSIQNLALPGNISQSFLETIKTGITQFVSYIASSVVTLIVQFH